MHRRIGIRTEQMLSGGAIEEVAALAGVPGNWSKAIGVKEILRLIAGEVSRSECAELISAATRQYAKRQETWFRREKWLKRVEL
jgi:tRNA dimethylallyltransferase